MIVMTLEELFEEYMRYPNFVNIALANVNQVGHFNQYPLHLASSRGNIEEMSLLIDNGANINIIGEYGSTPLHLACLRGHYNAVKLLIERGAIVSIKEDDGSTSLDVVKSMLSVEPTKELESILSLFT